MGRRRDQFLWEQVEVLADGWKCKYCSQKFKGAASRIRNHLSGIGNEISTCVSVPSNIRDEASKQNTKKRGRTSSVSPSTLTAEALPPLGDRKPSSSYGLFSVTKRATEECVTDASDGPGFVTERAAEVHVTDALMKLLMSNGFSSILSDAMNKPTVREFLKRACRNGVPLSLLGGDPFIIQKSLFNIKHEVYRYMLMVKESWKTTGCTLMTFNLNSKYVIGFYCPKGFIFVEAPFFFQSYYLDSGERGVLDAEIFKYALERHLPSLNMDDVIFTIGHESVQDCWLGNNFLCETSDYVCDEICDVYQEMADARMHQCLRNDIHKACIDVCSRSKWADGLISQAVQLHGFLLKRHDLYIWYCRNLARKGERMQREVGDRKEKHHEAARLSLFLLIMGLAVDLQKRLRDIRIIGYGCPLEDEIVNTEQKKIHDDSTFWDDGVKLDRILTLTLRIADLMDTLVPSAGNLGMELDKVEHALLEVDNKTSYHRITMADEAFAFWKQLESELRKHANPQSYLNPVYFLQQDDVSKIICELQEGLKRPHEGHGRFVREEEWPLLTAELEQYHDVFSRNFPAHTKPKDCHPLQLWERYGGNLPILQKWAMKLLSQPLTCMCNQVKKHVYHLEGADNYILRLNVKMMEEFNVCNIGKS